MFHRNSQKFCRYGNRTGLIDKKRGPITDIDDLIEFQEDRMDEDDLEKLKGMAPANRSVES